MYYSRYLIILSAHHDSSDQKKLVIFDIRTGMEQRSFLIDGAPVWPIFRWSKDDKYFARVGPNVLSVYETPVKSQKYLKNRIETNIFINFRKLFDSLSVCWIKRVSKSAVSRISCGRRRTTYWRTGLRRTKMCLPG